jgi:hypothetical protein
LDERVNDPKRKMFGGWQSDMKATQAVIGDLAIHAAGMQAATELIFSLIEKKGHDVSLVPEANLMKAWSAETAWRLATDVRHQFGGTGFNTQFKRDLQRIYEDILILRTVEGDDDAMFQAGSGLAFAQVGLDMLKLQKHGFRTLNPKNWLTLGFWKDSLSTLGLTKKVFWSDPHTFDTGVLSHKDAKWIHQRDRALATRMTLWAMKYGPRLIEQQNLNIEAGWVAAEQFALKAALIKLAKYGDKLPEKDVAHLKSFVALTKHSIDKRLADMKHLLPDVQIKLEAGKRHNEDYRTEHGVKSPRDLAREKRAAEKAAAGK